MSRRRDALVALFAVLLLGAALRVLLVARTDGVSSDSGRWIGTAFNLSRGSWAVPETVVGRGMRVDRLYPPLYPGLTAVVDRAAGDLVLSARLVSLAAGIAIVALTFALGSSFHGAAAGLAGAFLSATSLVLIEFSAAIMSEALFSALLLSALLLHLRGGPGGHLAAGVSLALAILTKPAAMPVALVLGAAIGLRQRDAPRRRLTLLAALLTPVALTVIVNTLVERQVVAACAISSNSALPFLHTLELHGDPTFPGWGVRNDFSILGYVLEHPERYARYAARSYLAGLSSLLARPPAPLLLAGVLGLVARLVTRARPRPATTVLLAVLAVFPLVPSLVIVHDVFMPRMMVPAAPILFVLVAGGLVDLCRVARDRLAPASPRRPPPRALVIVAGAALGALSLRAGVQSVGALVPSFERQKRIWRAAGTWINDHVAATVILDDHGDNGEFVTAYLLRDRLHLDTFDAIAERVARRRPGEPPEYLLLLRSDRIAEMAALQARSEGRDVVLLETFGGPAYSCQLLQLGR